MGKILYNRIYFLQIKKIFNILQSTSLVSVLQILMAPNVTQIVFLLVFLFSVRFLTLWPRLSSSMASDLQ